MNVPARRSGLRLLDMTALVVGYALAALLIRAFWHAPEWEPTVLSLVLGLVYLWLGLAMSGPIVLLLDRRAAPSATGHKRPGHWIGSRPPGRTPAEPAIAPNLPSSAQSAPEVQADEPSRYTRAELAWLTIGAYWIGMTFLVVPVRLHDTPLSLVAVLQIVAALALWVFVPRHKSPEALQSSWTHRAAIVLLVTWPVVWAAMILLSKAL